MKSFLKYIIFIQIFAIVACSDELGKKAEENKDVVLASTAFTSEVAPTEEANKYIITIRWQLEGASLIVTNLANKTRSAVDQKVSEFSETVDGGKTYKYRIEAQGSNKNSGKDLILEVPVPLDYVLSGEKTLTGDLVVSAERIFVRSNAFLKSRKHKIIFKSKQFIAQGGTLQSYGPDEKDCPGKIHGAPGGNITIESEAARGTLTINMMGAEGCYGSGGAGGYLTVKAKQGKDLLLNINFGSSAGGSESGVMGPPGSMPTSCISLSEEEPCN